MNTLGSICSSVEWRSLRNHLLDTLRRATIKGLVDPDILDELNILNNISCIVTSSSCSGRIALFAATSPGDKRGGGIVAKWHRPITSKELLQALGQEMLRKYEFVWVSAQPIIIALHTCDLEIANELIRISDRVGFKYSGMKITNKSYYVMIIGTERIDIPLRVGGNVFIDPSDAERIESLVKILNTYLSLAKRKLDRLKRALATSYTMLEKRCEEATLY